MKLNDTQIDVFEFVPMDPPKGWKPKMGVFGWRGDDLFIPADSTGWGEARVILCCAFDGIEVVSSGDTLLIPESWARKECPEKTRVFDAIRKGATEMREEFNRQSPAETR